MWEQLWYFDLDYICLSIIDRKIWQENLQAQHRVGAWALDVQSLWKVMGFKFLGQVIVNTCRPLGALICTNCAPVKFPSQEHTFRHLTCFNQLTSDKMTFIPRKENVKNKGLHKENKIQRLQQCTVSDSKINKFC